MPGLNAIPPTVSVVLPVHNSASVISETLDSVLGQTFSDFEFVVVDDASTDETGAIVDDYARRDERIQVHHLAQNRGVGGATNYGVTRARGRYIARMDHDDIALPHRLERQVAYLDRHPEVGAVGGLVEILGVEGHRRAKRRGPLAPAHIAWTLFFTNVMVHPTVMLRRDVLEAAGWYPDGYHVGTEDYALFLQLAASTRLAILPEVVLLYRVWGNNATSRAFERQEQEAARALQHALHAHWGVEASVEEARALRGLAVESYQVDPAGIGRTADVVRELITRFTSDGRWSRSELRPVKRDAAIRLWMLAALMARRAPLRAVPLALSAFRHRPSAVFRFLFKASERVASAIRRRLET